MRRGVHSARAARDLWLSELERAIEEAQLVAWRLGVVEGPNPQALDLYVRLESARAEIEALRERRLRNAGEISAGEIRLSLQP